jgi:hypothetical protein
VEGVLLSAAAVAVLVGLGALVEQHGGTITVRSRPGLGSTPRAAPRVGRGRTRDRSLP